MGEFSIPNSQSDLHEFLPHRSLFEANGQNSNSNTRQVSIPFKNELVFETSERSREFINENSQHSFISLGNKSLNDLNLNKSNGFHNINPIMEIESISNAGKENSIKMHSNDMIAIGEPEDSKKSSSRAVNSNLPKVLAKDCTPIKDFELGFIRRIRVKAKVMKKSVLRKFERNHAENRVFTVELVDAEGSMIQGSFFGDVAKTNYPLILENHVYVFTGGKIRAANPKFQT